MKYIMIILSLFLCSCYSNTDAGKENKENIQKIEEEYEKQKVYHENGKLKTVISVKDNKKNGPMSSYYEDGTLAATGYFKDDERDKKWTFYDEKTHEITAIENYSLGKLQGEQEYFYPSGILKLKGNCENDERIGFWSQYSPDGKLEIQNIFLGKGEGVNVAMFEPNGNIVCSGLVRDGARQGAWIYFDDNGKKLYEVNYEDGIKNGAWKAYDPQGNVLVTGFFNEGKMLGL